MYRKDVQEAIESTTKFLQKVISEEVDNSGGEIELPDECCWTAFATDGDVTVNYFEKVFRELGEIYVQYYDWAGKYKEPITLFSIDELIEIYSAL